MTTEHPGKNIIRNLHLTFPPEISNDPIVCNLTRLFDLNFNILQAQINPKREGFVILELEGNPEMLDKAVNYLRESDVIVSNASQRVFRNEESCMHCGMCTAICPRSVLKVNKNTYKIIFETERCTACGLCTKVCPVRAMQVEISGNW